jgi:protein-lysine methyltransferase-like protein
VAQALLQAVLSGLIECHVFDPGFVVEVNERPLASPLARVLAAQANRLPTRRHRMLEVDNLHRELIRALDGNRDRQALIDLLAERVRDGTPLLDENHQPVREPARVRELFANGLGRALEMLARNALLVG